MVAKIGTPLNIHLPDSEIWQVQKGSKLSNYTWQGERMAKKLPCWTCQVVRTWQVGTIHLPDSEIWQVQKGSKLSNYTWQGERMAKMLPCWTCQVVRTWQVGTIHLPGSKTRQVRKGYKSCQSLLAEKYNGKDVAVADLSGRGDLIGGSKSIITNFC